MKLKHALLIVSAILIQTLCACLTFALWGNNLGGTPTPSPTTIIAKIATVAISSPTNTATSVPPTPTKTSTPIDTPTPTNTATPTNTPTSTATPAPTSTPTATSTPTPSPTPVIINGSGDTIVNINKSSEPMLVHITGNASSRFFAVSNYDANYT